MTSFFPTYLPEFNAADLLDQDVIDPFGMASYVRRSSIHTSMTNIVFVVKLD